MSIVTVYSLEKGRESFVITFGKKRSTLLKPVFLQPFTVVDLEIEQGKKGNLGRIKEVHPAFPLLDLLFNPVKMMLASFLAELLYVTLHDTTSDSALFSFLENSVRILDLQDKGIANFHLVFVMELMRFLGYYPNISMKNVGEEFYFDMLNGQFVDRPPLHSHYLSSQESRSFLLLQRMTYQNMSLFHFSRKERQMILNRVLEYYRMHLPAFREIRSLAVLQDLFD